MVEEIIHSDVEGASPLHNYYPNKHCSGCIVGVCPYLDDVRDSFCL